MLLFNFNRVSLFVSALPVQLTLTQRLVLLRNSVRQARYKPIPPLFEDSGGSDTD